jgi:hypothetical protein
MHRFTPEFWRWRDGNEGRAPRNASDATCGGPDREFHRRILREFNRDARYARRAVARRLLIAVLVASAATEIDPPAP